MPFPVFSGATLASRLAHYLKPGKDPVIFSIHSLSDWMSALVGEWKDGRREGKQSKKRGRDGELEFGWGLGHWRKPDADKRKTRLRKGP